MGRLVNDGYRVTYKYHNGDDGYHYHKIRVESYEKACEYVNNTKGEYGINASLEPVYTVITPLDLRWDEPLNERETMQAITSKKTDLKQIPAIFKKVSWDSGTKNIDIGSGSSLRFTMALKGLE